MEIAVARPVDWGRIWKWLLALLGVMLMSIFIVRGSVTSSVDGSPELELACSNLGIYDSAGNGFTDGNCICSEPMATDEGGAFINAGHDFSDSPDTSECWGNRSGTQAFQAGATNANVMVSTSAWGDVPYVLKHANGGFIWLNPTDITSGALAFTSADRTWCTRYYIQVDETYSPSGSTQDGTSGNCEVTYGCALNDGYYNCRNKLTQTSWTSAFSQLQERADSNCPAVVGDHWDAVSTVDADNASLSPTIRVGEDCDTAPCRIEQCVDGNLSIGTNLVHRTRVHSIKTGVTGSATQGPNSFGAPANPDFWGGDMFHSGPDGDDYLGYFMEARWDTDNDDWIGPACEIEGGCAVGNIPPPPPQMLIIIK